VHGGLNPQTPGSAWRPGRLPPRGYVRHLQRRPRHRWTAAPAAACA